MATYTLRLSDIIEGGYDLGLNDYPIHDELHRASLNTKIINHYMNWEIGYETIEQFRFALNRRMNEIMPAYVELYKTISMEFDPFVTVDIEHTGSTTEATKADTDARTTAGSKTRAVTSETPQTQLSGNLDYASAVTDTVGESTSDSLTGSTSDTTATTSNRQKGFTGSRAQMLMEYRQTIMNVDLMVINDLEHLFMQLWGNLDNYSSNRFFSW